MMEKEQFDEICSLINIDENCKKNAIQQYSEISRNTILDVSGRGFVQSAAYYSVRSERDLLSLIKISPM